MRRVIILLLLCFPVIEAGSRDNDRNPLPGSPSGYIDITVESNVNRLFFKYDLKDACLTLSPALKTAIGSDPGMPVIRVPVKEFRSTNQMAYRDFLELVRAEEFPYLEIAVPDRPLPLNNEGHSVSLDGVAVTFTGVTRHYNISGKIEERDGDNRLLTGIIRIKLTDFDIDPPVKWAGLIRVRDEIIVKFGFCIRDMKIVPVKT